MSIKRRSINIKVAGGAFVKRNLYETALEGEIEYPQSWFASYPNSKPYLPLPDPNMELELINSSVMSDLNLSIEPALIFLWRNITKLFTGILDKEWTSYGTKIGNQGENINPSHILEERNVGTIELTKVVRQDVQDSEILKKIAHILAIYRVGPASQQPGDYKNVVMERIGKTLESEPFYIDEMDLGFIEERVGWSNDDRFKKICGAVDMFLNRFIDHRYSKLKVCLLGSRFRDCGSLTAIRDMGKFMGVPTLEAVDYFMDPKIGEELIRLTKEGEEYENPYSYFPYFRDLGLSKKSPFSNSVNPAIYNMVYSIGTLLLNKRSINARLFDENNITGTVLIAMYIGYFKATSIQPELIVGDDAGKEEYRRITEALGEELREMEINPKSIYQAMIESEFKIPEKIKQFHTRRILGLDKARDGTIGSYIQNFLK